jgi:polygalacturonase
MHLIKNHKNTIQPNNNYKTIVMRICKQFIVSIINILVLTAALACQSMTVSGSDIPIIQKFYPNISEEIEPIHAPFRVADLQRPVIPERECNIVDYGAKPGGEISNTQAISDAIDACHEAGGGTVRIPKGLWLTGAIHMKSNINLHVAEGAVVQFAEVLEEYLPPVHVRHEGVEAYNYSPLIYAAYVENIAITGPGVFDGRWDFWRDWAIEAQGEVAHRDRVSESPKPLEDRYFGKGAGRDGMRPNFLVTWHAENILVEGPTFKDGPMWNLHFVYSQNIIVRNVSVLSLPTHNGDGIVIDSSNDVLIEYVYLETSDDAVVIKSGLNEDGRLIDIPSQRIVVRNFIARDVRTGSGGIVFGSETSGGINDVYVHDAHFDGSDRGIRFKSGPGRGSYVTDIHVRDITLKNVTNEAINFNLYYSIDAEPEIAANPRFRNIFISNIQADGAREAIHGAGLPGQVIRNVRISNAVFKNMQRGATFRQIDGLHLENVEIQSEGTPLKLIDVYNVNMSNVLLEGAEPTLTIEGDSDKISRDGNTIR